MHKDPVPTVKPPDSLSPHKLTTNNTLKSIPPRHHAHATHLHGDHHLWAVGAQHAHTITGAKAHALVRGVDGCGERWGWVAV